MSSRSGTRPPVIIIGAGLASLALAQGLRKQGIPVRVFERDSSANYRPQGYRIKTFEQTDLDLEYLLPPHLLRTFYASCAETVLGESTYNAISGQKTASRPGWKPRPWTVDREVLRNVLLLDLEAGREIEFGKEFGRYEVAHDGDSITAVFTDGSRVHGAFLVGGDGVRSKARRQLLPNHRAIDTTGVCIYGKTPFTPELAAGFPVDAVRWISTFVDEAPRLTQVMSGRNDAVTLFVDPMRFKNRADPDVRVSLPDDYVYWAILMRRNLIPAGADQQYEERGAQKARDSMQKSDNRTNDGNDRLESLHGAAARKLSLDVTGEWDPAVRTMLELQDTNRSAVLPILCAHPDLPDWAANDRVTVIGDAVHAMPPSGAVGAVAALHDAALLVAEFATAKGASGSSGISEMDGFETKYISRDGVARYENAMRENARAGIRRSGRAGAILFGQPPFEECKEIKM